MYALTGSVAFSEVKICSQSFIAIATLLLAIFTASNTLDKMFSCEYLIIVVNY